MKSTDESIQVSSKVNLPTLDDIVKTYALTKVLAIKLDIEGVELSVLGGVSET